MGDPYRLDGQKLLYHPQRVADYLAGREVYPIYLEVSPSGGCNHRCVFCAVDFMGYEARFLNPDLWSERVAELAALGIRAVMFAGEGEPLLNRGIARMVADTKAAGIDVSMTTNGVLLTPELAENLLPHLSWLRISFNAGTPETYSKLHRAPPGDFTRALANVRAAADLIARTGSSCVLSLQAVMLPENAGEMTALAHLAREAGAAYFSIKPFSQHLKSATRTFSDLDYGGLAPLRGELDGVETPAFRVFFRERAFEKASEEERPYGKCLALPFWAYVDSGAEVWACSAHLTDPRFYLGSLAEESFAAIWTGEKRRELARYTADCLDPALCRINCRMDEVNRFLWELTHPPAHVNFI